jgi:PAS domain S-box-containing protein
MVKKNKRIMYAALVCAFILTVFSVCEKSSKEQSNAAIETLSFRNIPGITQSEINAIENLRKKYSFFEYGINPTTEAFIGKDGELDGYAVMFCGWLSEIFGIQFKPVYYQWGDLLRGLKSGEIDFTGELMSTSENQPNYFMTSPTVNRTIKIYRINGSQPVEEIIPSRAPRYVFLRGAVVAADITANAVYGFEEIMVDNHEEAYQMLKSGRADAFFGLDTAEGAFDEYDDMRGEEFFPLIFRSSCLTTQKEELKPVISVMEKAIDDRVLEYLTALQKSGYEKYQKNRIYTLLTEEERSYIQNNPVISVAAEFDNYPISFFETRANQWRGIYFEALDEIEKLTGLTFKVGNDHDKSTPELVAMLEKGDVRIMPELFRIKDYEGRFLWSEIPVLRDNYVLISRADFRNININDIFHLQVGIRKNTSYSELFKKMFPAHRDFTEYDTQGAAWDGLKRGEFDILFASRRRLLIYTNYYEETGYKLNLVFNHSFDTFFGYNKDAAILKSIVDKALLVVNINNISNQWIYKTYDYRNKVAQAQRPWLIGTAVLFFFVLLLVLILLIRSRSAGKELENLVKDRTGALAFETFKLQAMITSIPDLMFCKNTNLKYTQCNKQFEKFMGVSEADILGKSDKDGTWFSSEQADRIYNIERTIIDENRIIILEEKVISPATGKECVFETVKAPLIQNNAVVGIIAIVRDITKRKEMEEEVQAASRAKSAFLANMSHELRTPLNVVIGLTDLVLEDDNINEHVTDNLIKISSAGSTLLSIVNDILDFSKIESGRLELAPVEYYTSSLLNDVITLAITRLGEKPVTFHLDISDNLPAKLYGDDLRLKQIFTNLLTNAVKYTLQGSIELCVHCAREGDTVWMSIAVRDTGVGIREEDKKKLFLDYYQIDSHANRNIEGTGLGLPITKRLAMMMDGKIGVESEYGKGTTFSVRVRQGFVSDTPIGSDIANKLRNFCYAEDKRIVTKKLVRADLSYAKVLVVDDMQTNLDVASGLLRKYKMQVDCLSSGQDAVQRIRDGTPVYNAVFMDHMMPGMDGVEAATAIRALDTEYAKKIPIIALTANAIQGTEQMFYENGFQAFISKPIDVMEMDSVIRKWVRKNTHENAPASGVSSADLPSENENEENMIIEIPGVDTKKGLSLYADETDVYLPLLRSYVANTPGVLDKLRAVSAETLSAYVITVHGLKGTSAGIGAEAIREAALDLETKSRVGDLQGVLARNGKLISDTETIVANVKTWLEQYDANSEKKPRLKAPDRELLFQLRQSCENYDMVGIDKAISELEKSDYEEDADLIVWLRKKIEMSEFAEAAERLAKI